MRNVSDKSYTELHNTHFMLNTFFENRAVRKIMLKNVIQPARPQMTTWRTRIACWIPKATDTHTGCVIFIAFPLQQWFHERASVLRYTYRGAEKSLARLGKKQATATEDFEFHMSYL